MAIEATTITFPAHWASALINGDASGMTETEEAEMDAYLERALAGGWYVVSDVEDSERYTNSYALYQANPHFTGGTVLDYVIHRSI